MKRIEDSYSANFDVRIYVAEKALAESWGAEYNDIGKLERHMRSAAQQKRQK